MSPGGTKLGACQRVALYPLRAIVVRVAAICTRSREVLLLRDRSHNVRIRSIVVRWIPPRLLLGACSSYDTL